MTTGRKSRGLGLHEESERRRAYRRAKDAYDRGLTFRPGTEARAHAEGYIQAVRDMAFDHGEIELGRLVQDLWFALEGAD